MEKDEYGDVEVRTLADIQKHLSDFAITIPNFQNEAQEILSDPIYFGDEHVCSRLKIHTNPVFPSAVQEGECKSQVLVYLIFELLVPRAELCEPPHAVRLEKALFP